MRRDLLPAAVVAGALFAFTGCGTSTDSGTGGTSPAVPATSATPQITFSMAMACQSVDAVYTSLSSSSQAVIAKGVRAEATGDTATARAALAALKPIFVSTGHTFTDTASKVPDPEMKAALDQLAESAGKQAAFTSFAQFRTLEAMTAAPESVLKQKCAQAGHPLKNIE